jgi:hypothetical protein
MARGPASPPRRGFPRPASYPRPGAPARRPALTPAWLPPPGLGPVPASARPALARPGPGAPWLPPSPRHAQLVPPPAPASARWRACSAPSHRRPAPCPGAHPHPAQPPHPSAPPCVASPARPCSPPRCGPCAAQPRHGVASARAAAVPLRGEAPCLRLGPGVCTTRLRRVSAALRALVLAWCVRRLGAVRCAHDATRSALPHSRRARLPLATRLPPPPVYFMRVDHVIYIDEMELYSEIDHISYLM